MDFETPAEYLIRRIGGVRKTAVLFNRTHPTVVKWRRPKVKGGTDGRIPGTLHSRARAIAKKLGFPLTPSQLLIGNK